HAGPYGGVDQRAVPLDEGDHLVARREAIGPGPAILLAGQPEAPVGELEHQRVPALAPPALGHPSPLEDHVGAPTAAQVMAEGQPRVPTAHDHRLVLGRHDATRLRRCAGLVNPSAARPLSWGRAAARVESASRGSRTRAVSARSPCAAEWPGTGSA